MTPEPFTILFANVGRRVSLIRAFAEAVRRLGLPARILGVDANPLSPAYYVTDESFPICRIREEAYIPALHKNAFTLERLPAFGQFKQIGVQQGDQ